VQPEISYFPGLSSEAACSVYEAQRYVHTSLMLSFLIRMQPGSDALAMAASALGPRPSSTILIQEHQAPQLTNLTTCQLIETDKMTAFL
jgi:hypothetical protein